MHKREQFSGNQKANSITMQLYCGQRVFQKPLRLKGPEQKLAIVKSYTTRAKVRIVHRAAASAWMQGVPWSEALEIATKALRTADGTPRKLVFAKRGKGKGRGKGNGKAKG
jgi:hypothetical protein